MNTKIRVPDGDRVKAALTRVPHMPAAVTAAAALTYTVLALSGMTWWIALGTAVTALAVAFVVGWVPRHMELPNDIQHLTDEDQEALFEDAYARRMEQRAQLIAAGVIPLDDDREGD